MLTPKQVAAALNAIASETEATGKVPLAKLVTLLAHIEAGIRNKRASTGSNKAAAAFRKAAADLTAAVLPSPVAMANWLRNVIADTIQPTSAQVAAAIYQQASSVEEVKKKFKDAQPSLTDEHLEEIGANWEKHHNVVKDKQV